MKQAQTTPNVSPSNSTQGVSLLPPTLEGFPESSETRVEGLESHGTVAVLMSGGVDSSVTALLLKEKGWDVVGVTMKIPMAEQCEHPRPCCGGQAALVCRDLGVPHHFVEVGEAFETHVIEPFRRDYSEGRTPSPCVDCNTYLKFGLVWDLVEEALGIRTVATGHYAQILRRSDRDGETQQGSRWSYHLARGKSAARDQSYFLYGVPRERLGRLLFPLGDMEKDEIRELARRGNLQVAESQDSMELCFAGEGDYRQALGEDGLGLPGSIVDPQGAEIGRHRGIRHYTVGQRRGLGIGGSGDPVYVLGINPRTNTIIAGPREAALRHKVSANRLNVLDPKLYHPGTPLFGRIRSGGEPEPCELIDASAERMEVRFDVPIFAPAPGQHLVLYDSNDCVVCGGTLENIDYD